MKKGWTLVLVLASGCAAQTGPKNPFAGDKTVLEPARGSFRIMCGPCHGILGEGGRGPDLRTGTFFAGSSDADLYRVISEGVAGTEMADFGLRLGDENVWRMVTYIRSIAGKPSPPPHGDKAAGEKLFWEKGGCGQCHRVGAKGGRMGPDLTLAGRQRSLAYLRESVETPDAFLTPGFNTITVTLRDGKTVAGVQRGYDGFSAQFLDSSDNFHSYFRDQVASMKREFRSIMPGTYGKMFTPSQINDLLVYMTSLRGTGGSR